MGENTAAIPQHIAIQQVLVARIAEEVPPLGA
jgi:hypothetical protein